MTCNDDDNDNDDNDNDNDDDDDDGDNDNDNDNDDKNDRNNAIHQYTKHTLCKIRHRHWVFILQDSRPCAIDETLDYTGKIQ